MARTVLVKAITIAAASAMLLPAAFGQSKGGGAGAPGTTGPATTTGTGTGTGTGTTGTTPTIGRPTTTNPNSTPQQPTVNIPQPIFLSGRVMLEDGTPPSEPLVMETVCNGVGHAEGYTDAKGYFSLELGANRGIIQDASEFSSSS